MPVSDPYADPPTYRAVVTKSDSGSDAEVLQDLVAISRYLDRRLGRFFSKDAAPVARMYRARAILLGRQSKVLDILAIRYRLVFAAPQRVRPGTHRCDGEGPRRGRQGHWMLVAR